MGRNSDVTDIAILPTHNDYKIMLYNCKIILKKFFVAKTPENQFFLLYKKQTSVMYRVMSRQNEYDTEVTKSIEAMLVLG